MKNFAFLILGVFIIASCSTVNHTANDYIQVEDDPFKTSIIYSGISKQDSQWKGLRNELTHTSFIKSYKDKESGSLKHELYAAVTYHGDWHLFERAALRGGTDTEFSLIDKTIEYCSDISCRRTEEFTIPLEEKFLIENKDGFDMKVFAQSGKEFILSVTNLQISAQLSYLGVE